MFILAYSNAFSVLWPVFGAANQLLAALALFTVSSWLVIKGRKYVFALYPALFMLVTTITAVVFLLLDHVRKDNYILIVVDLLLFLLSIGVIILAGRIFFKQRKRNVPA